MAHLNRQELAEAAIDVFANNEGSVFHATQDGSFFINELDAKYNARAVGGKIETFYREEIEAEQEPAEIEAEATAEVKAEQPAEVEEPAEEPAEVEATPATAEEDLAVVTKPVSKKK